MQFLAMKLLFLFTIATCLQASATGYGQTVSLSLQNAPLEKAFTEIKRQTGYNFVYTRAQLSNTKPVSVQVVNGSLKEVLEKCFQDQPLWFVLEDKYVVVQNRKVSVEVPFLNITGRVINEQAVPLAGVTITAKPSGKITSTNAEGEFQLKDISEDEILVITSIGYQAQEIAVNNRTMILVKLKVSISQLDETMVMAYGKTSMRLSTGNISKVSSAELERQPVGNPLLALTGRVPGLNITQSSGLNGAAVKVQIRGQNSILQGSDPLYIIDGIPYAPGNSRLNQLINATGEIGMSPFNLVSMDNIESIEVLKDADATAIYGSRGANGVILITTKKGSPGKTRFTANVNTGISRVTRTMDMLNTEQYIQMRREAFRNDGLEPSADPLNPGYAPDIMIWDSTRYTDLKKMLIGGTARITNAQVSVSGGSASTQFLIGAAYLRQTTVFPTDHGETKASANFSITHTSTDKKFSIRLNGNYLANENKLNVSDLTSFINLPPNIRLRDEEGKVSWAEGGVPIRFVLFRVNPLAPLNTSYTGKYRNLISNLELGYMIVPGLQSRISFGYNNLQGNEYSAEPSTSIDPNSGNLPSANFSNNSISSWIIEPQLEYTKAFRFGTVTALAGATWQENRSEGISAQGYNYRNDAMLGSISGAGDVFTSNNFSQYRYNALFGRINYNFRNRYIVNASGRRDGSSRFGPADRFANFGAIGAAWIFTEERFLKEQWKLLSFGKIRASWGITGNDQIGDYRYLETWTAIPNTYQGVPITEPTSLFNPTYSWERNQKLEAAIELGFLENKIMFSLAFYKNRSNNQLINYTLPIQTGFNSVLQNQNAQLENKGLELQLSTKNISTANFSWNSSFNLSINRNKLVSFPGLASSSYANTYVIGKSITTRKLYYSKGVNPATGLYEFEDVDRNGILNIADRINYRNVDPKFIGGFSNELKYRNLSLSLFFEFRKQDGYNFISNNTNTFTPGYRPFNHPVGVLDRWQNEGDVTDVQKFAARVSSPVVTNMNLYVPLSDANITDASIIRCKNVSLSYALSAELLKKMKIDRCLLYINAQNLFVLTKYRGADPEVQNLYILPPLRTISGGINLTF